MSLVRKLFWMDFHYRIRNRKILLTIAALVLVYGLIFYLNLPVYQSLESGGLYLKVPLLEPVKTYSYFGYFTSAEDAVAGEELGTGYLYIPDRYEDPGLVTSTWRFYFLALAVIIILFASNELHEYSNKNLYQSLLLTPVSRRDLWRTKLLTGAAVVGLAVVMQIIFVCWMLWLLRVEFSTVQYQQVVVYGFTTGLMLYLIYVIALSIGVRGKESGMSLLYSLLVLVILVYLVPVACENFRNAVYYQLPKAWRGSWYWYSRYLAVVDPFGSFGTFTSEVLFFERAQTFYSSLPWSHALAADGSFTIWKLIQLDWFKPLGIILWIIGIWIGVERRMA